MSLSRYAHGIVASVSADTINPAIAGRALEDVIGFVLGLLAKPLSDDFAAS
jgi:hypothetical protein